LAVHICHGFPTWSWCLQFGRRYVEVSLCSLPVEELTLTTNCRFHRAMTRPFFSRERVSDFELFARHADEALKKLRDRLREGEAVDAQDLVSRFTLDSATEFVSNTLCSSPHIFNDISALWLLCQLPLRSAPLFTARRSPSV
jgi:hypothetical protein